MTTRSIRTVLGNWLLEARPEGLYVLVEEIGGQGELGPFPDEEAARSGLVAYLGSGPASQARPPSRLPSALKALPAEARTGREDS